MQIKLISISTDPDYSLSEIIQFYTQKDDPSTTTFIDTSQNRAIVAWRRICIAAQRVDVCQTEVVNWHDAGVCQ